MINQFVKKFVFVIFLFFVISCNNNAIELPNINEKAQQLYLIPNNYQNFEIKPLIRSSGLNRGGYALIISDGSKQTNASVNKIITSLVKNQIIAYHIIKISERKLMTTEKLTIENANLIIVLGKFSESESMMSKRSELGYFINKAYNNKSVVASYGRNRVFTGLTYCKEAYSKNNNCNSFFGLDLVDYETVFNNENNNSKSTRLINDSILITNSSEPVLVLNRSDVYMIEALW